MNLIQNSKIFLVNSTNRVSGTHSNFQFYLNILPADGFDRCVVLRGTFPKSFYMVGPGEYFTLREGALTAQIAIPQGSYNYRSFQTVCASALNAASPSGWGYAITFPNVATEAQTGKYTFTVTGNGGVQPEFIFTTFLYEQMGFAQGSTVTFTGDTVTSTNVITMQREVSLLLNSDIVRNNSGDSILQDIYPASGDPNFGYISHVMSDLEAESRPINPDATKSIITFYLTDENFTPIDTNGIPMVFTLLCYKASIFRSTIITFTKILSSIMKANDLHNVDKLVQNDEKNVKKDEKLEEEVAKNDQKALDNPAP